MMRSKLTETESVRLYLAHHEADSEANTWKAILKTHFIEWHTLKAATGRLFTKLLATKYVEAIEKYLCSSFGKFTLSFSRMKAEGK